jgi:hypothetical protein
MMPTTRAVYACVKGLTAGVTGARGYILVAGITVALLGVAVWLAAWRLGVTRAAEPPGGRRVPPPWWPKGQSSSPWISHLSVA